MKILILSSRYPYPLEKGDKLRLFHQIQGLSEDHEIVLVSLTDVLPSAASKKVMSEYVSAQYVFPLTSIERIWSLCRYGLSKMPFQQMYFYQRSIQKKINEIYQKEKPDHVYCQLTRMAKYAENFDGPKSIDYMDAFSKGMELRKQNASIFKRLFYHLEAKRLREYEEKVFDHFNQHFIISHQDKSSFQFKKAQQIHVVPNGVDIEYFKMIKKQKQYDIVFAGNMGYQPNIEAVEYLLNAILPALRQRGHDPKVLIAGARPEKSLKQLGTDRVIISGWMDDIRVAYSESRMLMAPLFTGIGQQNKILESMAMGTPCITSTMVNNAIGASHKNQMMIADRCEEYVQAYEELTNDVMLSKQLSENGNTFVREQYSWTKVRKILNQYFA